MDDLIRFDIAPDVPSADDVVEVLEAHARLMDATSPPEDTHYLTAGELADPSITFVSARTIVDGGRSVLLGVGALQRLDEHHAEIKSMHTLPTARRCGVARALVVHLVDLARRLGCSQVSLETGTMAEFEPARALYRSCGFRACGPFANYVESPNSTFLTREL